MIPRTTRIAIEIFDATCTDNLVGYDAFLSHALLPAGLSYEAADALWHGLERRGHELRRPEIIACAAKFADEFERVHRFLYQQRMATTTSDVASPSDLLLGDVASTSLAFQWHGVQAISPPLSGVLPPGTNGPRPRRTYHTRRARRP